MSTTTTTENDVILGKNMSNTQRILAFLSVAIIYFFYCHNFNLGTFVKPTMINELGFTLPQTEEIFAVMSLGTIPGTFIFAMLSTKIGKKRTLITIAGLIALTTYLPLVNPTSLALWKGARFVCGFVLGGVFGSAMPLIADMFPSKFRGKLAATLTALFSVAMIFGGQIYGFLGDENWQILMYTAIIPPVVGGIMAFFFVPDDYEMTKELVAKGKETGEKVSYFQMYRGKYLWIGIGCIILSGVNFTSYSSFSNNATTYLTQTVGLSAAVAGSIFSLQGVGQLAGYFAWGAIADKFGRRVPAIGMLCAAAGIFFYSRLSADSVTAFMITTVLLGFCFGYSGAWGAYYTELFPSKFRSISSGMSFNGGRIISTFSLPAMAGLVVANADGTSNFMPLFTAAIIVFVLGSVLWFFMPETLNKKED